MSVREIQHPERETSTVEAAGGYVRRMVQTEARGWGRPVSIADAYDAAKDAHDSYYAAIEAKRARGDHLPKLYCVDCDRYERDPIFLDVERCSRCGEHIEAAA